MTSPRLLVVMGSGETSPTMVKAHRELLGRLGPGPVPAAMLDTPFGFQTNADDIAARAVRYFRDSVGHDLAVAGFRAAGTDPVVHEAALARLRRAAYVFAGPGSPSYALRQWRGSLVPKILAEKLESGGCICFASAAALTLGLATVPVYEIYKVGEDPHWLEGLDLLALAGLRAAVIPHYDNAEGGTHDTRFCYLGEERLAGMEARLPEDAFVLGVDEHTGLVLDLEAATATVLGLGGVTVRKDGRSSRVPSGSTVAIPDLAGLARHPSAGDAPGPGGEPGHGVTGAPRAGPGPSPARRPGRSPLLDAIAGHEAGFVAALEARDVAGAVRAALELEEGLRAWAEDTLQSDHVDRGRAVLRSMLVRLGEVADNGARDPAEVLGPFVEALIGLRERARAERRWGEADDLRRTLAGLGVEVRDSPEGTTWRLLS